MIFLQRLTFSTNTCQKLRGIYNLVEHLQWSFFAKKNFFLQNSQEKHLCRSLFLIKLQVSILQLDWKKGLQHRCFLMNFARYLRHLFDRTPPCDCFCSTEKCFTNKIAKNPWVKKKNGNTCKKNNVTGKTKT